jgi:hypothetical protein
MYKYIKNFLMFKEMEMLATLIWSSHTTYMLKYHTLPHKSVQLK